MSYIKPHMTEAFEGSTLERLDSGADIVAFKLTPPKRFHWCYLMFTPLGVVIGGDQRFGDTNHGAAVASGYGLDFFLKAEYEDYMGAKFFGKEPSGKAGSSSWQVDVGWMAALRKEFIRLYEAKAFGKPASQPA